MEARCTPAHVRQVRGCGGTLGIYRNEFVNVQSLYLARKYKQCITLCEDLQGLKLHPLHEGFLWYYHAICNECMGLAAHNFSRNKVHFLELARDSLDTALRVLPLPYATSTLQNQKEHEESPLAARSPTKAVHYRLNIHSPPTPCDNTLSLPVSNSIDSMYSVQTCPSKPQYDSSGEETEEGEDEGGVPAEILPPHQSPTPTTSTASDPTHKDRLLKSLSTMHTLTEELVPSPLFSRLRKSATISQEPEPSDSGCHDTRGSTSKPLPPLPFNHKTDFQVLGTRIVQIPKSTPVRKTAVQTLIARYDGLLPFPPSPVSTDPLWSPFPITPRYDKIKEAFSLDTHNHHLEAYLYCADLTHYNASLSEFRHQLRNQLTFINTQLNQVHAAQAEHAQSKALTQNRLASFWSLDPASHSARDISRSTSATGERGPPDPRATARQARIEKLRRNGWAVSKESHGFKGEQYYDGLRRIAERELEALDRLHKRLTSVEL
ncbi:hypothetical protein LTR84_004513 [Exophiala bonariae]|uniref:Uncharacterized protein n=1 Tax=Exophiala bonariae TaxID=1690606 RepID=A0AAV9NR05_9EURO|nr:hypothetical protein LTR84_004513 [Exophiala bonariae]